MSMNNYSHINKNYNNSDGVILKIGLHQAQNRSTLNQEEGTSTLYLMMKIMNI